MLADFQQGLADLTASPDLCVSARRDPSILRQRYMLTDREWRRLVSIVNHPGMQCACIVYRANRLAPLALNVPRLCRALGKDELRALASEYWSSFPEANVHFYVEADRFCEFIKGHVARGRVFSPEVLLALESESKAVAAAVRESRTEAG